MNPNLPQRRLIARLATRQNGNVTRQQLLDLGVGAEAIKYRVRIGELYRVHFGVYAVGRPPATPLERAAAAVLACGPGAALSHSSAMTLWGFWKRWDSPFEVVVPGDRRPKGIKVHRPTTLRHHDLTVLRGIRVTTPARTLFDMAPRLTDKQRKRAVNDALLSNYMRQSNLSELLRRHPRHRATPLLAPLVEDQGGLTRSELEDEFIDFCQRYALPRPQVNVTVGGYLVDAFFEAERLIVELDSWRFHSGRQSFERDRNRDADALSQGIGTVRITHERLHTDPDGEAERLLKILQQRRGR